MFSSTDVGKCKKLFVECFCQSYIHRIIVLQGSRDEIKIDAAKNIENFVNVVGFGLSTATVSVGIAAGIAGIAAAPATEGISVAAGGLTFVASLGAAAGLLFPGLVLGAMRKIRHKYEKQQTKKSERVVDVLPAQLLPEMTTYVMYAAYELARVFEYQLTRLEDNAIKELAKIAVERIENYFIKQNKKKIVTGGDEKKIVKIICQAVINGYSSANKTVRWKLKNEELEKEEKKKKEWSANKIFSEPKLRILFKDGSNDQKKYSYNKYKKNNPIQEISNTITQVEDYGYKDLLPDENASQPKEKWNNSSYEKIGTDGNYEPETLWIEAEDIEAYVAHIQKEDNEWKQGKCALMSLNEFITKRFRNEWWRQGRMVIATYAGKFSSLSNNNSLKNKTYARCNFTGSDFCYADLSNNDFTESKFDKTILIETKCKTSKLIATSFKQSYCVRTKFTNSDIVGAVFEETNLIGADFQGVTYKEQGTEVKNKKAKIKNSIISESTKINSVAFEEIVDKEMQEISMELEQLKNQLLNLEKLKMFKPFVASGEDDEVNDEELSEKEIQNMLSADELIYFFAFVDTRDIPVYLFFQLYLNSQKINDEQKDKKSLTIFAEYKNWLKNLAKINLIHWDKKSSVFSINPKVQDKIWNPFVTLDMSKRDKIMCKYLGVFNELFNHNTYTSDQETQNAIFIKHAEKIWAQISKVISPQSSSQEIIKGVAKYNELAVRVLSNQSQSNQSQLIFPLIYLLNTIASYYTQTEKGKDAKVKAGTVLKEIMNMAIALQERQQQKKSVNTQTNTNTNNINNVSQKNDNEKKQIINSNLSAVKNNTDQPISNSSGEKDSEINAIYDVLVEIDPTFFLVQEYAYTIYTLARTYYYDKVQEEKLEYYGYAAQAEKICKKIDSDQKRKDRNRRPFFLPLLVQRSCILYQLLEDKDKVSLNKAIKEYNKLLPEDNPPQNEDPNHWLYENLDGKIINLRLDYFYKQICYRQLAKACRLLGKFNDAQEYAAKSVQCGEEEQQITGKKSSKVSAAYVEKGNTLFAQGKYPEAQEVFEKAMRLEQSQKRGYQTYPLGEAYLGLTKLHLQLAKNEQHGSVEYFYQYKNAESYAKKCLKFMTEQHSEQEERLIEAKKLFKEAIETPIQNIVQSVLKSESNKFEKIEKTKKIEKIEGEGGEKTTGNTQIKIIQTEVEKYKNEKETQTNNFPFFNQRNNKQNENVQQQVVPQPQLLCNTSNNVNVPQPGLSNQQP